MTTHTIEVFRPGTFRPMEGPAITFSAADLAAMALAYDPVAAPAPAVIGHPQTDAPAYGWASSFSYDAARQRLMACIGELEPNFSARVKEGRYKKISLSIFAPDAPHNPKPGTWYPKHIGFLGAAAPAVSGLRPVAFGADATGVVTFEFSGADMIRDVGGVFRSLREWIIAKFGLEAADQALPGYTIGWIAEAGLVPEAEQPAFAAAPAITAKTIITKETSMDRSQEAGAAAALEARERILAERERALAHAENAAFAESIIADGRLIPAFKERVTGLLNVLSVPGAPGLEASFAEGAATKTVSALDLVKEILSGAPKVVSFGTHPMGDAPPVSNFAAPDGLGVDPASLELDARARAYQQAHPGTDYMAAVAAVQV